VARLHEASTVHKPKLVQQENDIPLCTKPPGNVYISLEKKIPVIREKLSGNSFEVILFDQTSDFFTKPFPSRVMFNYLVNGRGRRKVMSIEEVKELKLIRALMFKSHGQCLIQPILHWSIDIANQGYFHVLISRILSCTDIQDTFMYWYPGYFHVQILWKTIFSTYRSLKSSAEQNQIYSVDFMCFSVPGYLLLLYNYKLKIYSYRTIQPRY